MTDPSTPREQAVRRRIGDPTVRDLSSYRIGYDDAVRDIGLSSRAGGVVTERKPTRRDFPVMFTMAEARRLYPSSPRVFVACSCCHLAIDPRAGQRHVKACMRRKRLAPELWAAWRKDMVAP